MKHRVALETRYNSINRDVISIVEIAVERRWYVTDVSPELANNTKNYVSLFVT